jgi:hypothetical protein
MRSMITACLLMVAAASLRGDDLVPLNDLGPRPYRLGYFGGLYDDGTNTMPADHLAAGLSIAKQIQPLDANGNPSPSGKIVFLGVGTGDTTRVICSLYAYLPCEPGSFMSLLNGNPRVNPALVVINAAHEDFQTILFTGYGDAIFDRMQNSLLLPAGVTEKQVQAAWIQLSSPHPFTTIEKAYGDAYLVKNGIAMTIRSLRERYPNLRIAYLSSRPYGGYSPNSWNTEPFAYETGFSARWVIVQQIREERSGVAYEDPRTGPVFYSNGRAPWIAWGPYLWANGATPRSDGLTWLPDDFDGEFLSEGGAHKSAAMLLHFLMTEPTARNWFLAPAAPARSHAVRH